MGAGAFLWRQCEGKDKLTEQEALERATQLSHKQHERVNAYECAVCSPYWHVGRNHRRRVGRRRNGGYE
jgi:hypothetical protein